MNKNISQFVMLLIGVSTYDLFFWEEKFGINCLLFSVIMIGYTILSDRKLTLSKPVILTAFGTIVTATLIVVNNSLFSKTIHVLSFLSFIGFAKVCVGICFILRRSQVIECFNNHLLTCGFISIGYSCL